MRTNTTTDPRTVRPIFLFALVAALSLVFLASCDVQGRTPSTDQVQAQQTEQMVAEANRQVGAPNIVNFTERKFFKMIRELCDQEISTYTYIVDMNGRRHFLCESVGYGIPYSTQFVNPERPVFQKGYQSITGVTIPQPEPNGLFMPTSSSATWVLAATENGIQPIYVESEILVSPFRLDD